MSVSRWWSRAVRSVRDLMARDAQRIHALDALCGLTSHADNRRASFIRLQPEWFRREASLHNRK